MRQHPVDVSDPSEIRYARAGELNIAWQEWGDGPLELVAVGGPANNIEIAWEDAGMRRYLERLGTFARVVAFDRRGTGLSDPVTVAPTLEQYGEDLTAVTAAAGMTRHALIGGSEAGRMCILYAASFPERVTSLVLHGTSPDGSIVLPEPVRERALEIIEGSWGRGDMLELFAPAHAHDPAARAYMGRIERFSASPGMARRLVELSAQTDVSNVLGAVRVPTLVVGRTEDRFAPLHAVRAMAEAIPDARFVELPGSANVPWLDDSDALLDEVEEFLTGHRPSREPDRVLATILFTDICGSTAHAARLGDAAWRSVLAEHDRLVREVLATHRGREIKTLGDGFLATFDGPARGVRCAAEISERVRALGLQVRAGLHTGEVEVLPGDIAGVAVHIAQRISDVARADEVLVSRTVHDLVVGSGLRFAAHGRHDLPGVPDEWDLYAVAHRSLP
jgi:class 3 adenylate cyclase